MHEQEVEEFMKHNDWEPPNYRFVVLVLLLAVFLMMVAPLILKVW